MCTVFDEQQFPLLECLYCILTTACCAFSTMLVLPCTAVMGHSGGCPAGPKLLALGWSTTKAVHDESKTQLAQWYSYTVGMGILLYCNCSALCSGQ